MPKVKVDHIISFSSEDPVHVASNILSSDTSKKWKCQTPGEKNAIVVLQLEKAVVIAGIDIGNEYSAFVEVLVSRSGTNDDYKVLLVSSSFMTPLDSRQKQNVNKVRMFTKEHFTKPVCDEKWDRVKVVCTQPFNKHVQYGLAFINIHTSQDKPAIPTQATIGKFVLRPESPDDLTSETFFEKQLRVKQEEKLTGAAAIRQASSLSSLALHGSPVCKPKLITNSTPSGSKRCSTSDKSEEDAKPRDRNELLYSKDEEEPNEKIDKIMEKNKQETKEKQLDSSKDGTPKRKAKDDTPKTAKKKKENLPGVSTDTPSSSRKTNGRKDEENIYKRKANDDESRTDENKRKKREKNSKPFSRLLEGVTLVISGIQNPDRANLRAQALAMGAKYKPDWDDACTHLICAFPNTPKFNQVRGKGKIVKRAWIEKCHSERKRLPWRRFALDRNDVGKDESEEEIWEEVKIDRPRRVEQNNDSDNRLTTKRSAVNKTVKKSPLLGKIEAVSESDSYSRSASLGNSLNNPKNNSKNGDNMIILRKIEQVSDSESDDDALLPTKRSVPNKTVNKSPLPRKIETVSDSETDDNDSPTKHSTVNKNVKKPPLLRKIETVSDSETDDEHREAYSDTDERIAEIIRKDREEEDDLYNADTEEETETRQRETIANKTKNLFDGKTFYIDNVLNEEICRKLTKYVEAYKGTLSKDSENVDFVVTEQENGRALRKFDSDVVFLRPDWILDCHELQKVLPTDKYVY